MPQQNRRRRPQQRSLRKTNAYKAGKLAVKDWSNTNLELKSATYNFDSLQNITNSGSFHVVTANATIANGSGKGQRIGDAINLKSVLIRGELVFASGGVEINTVRIMLFRWFDDVVPNVESIFGEVLPGSPYHALSRDEGSKIQMLYDKMFLINPNNSIASRKLFHIYRRLRGKAEYYEDNTSKTGHLVLLFLSDSLATTHPTTRFNVRIRYTDP